MKNLIKKILKEEIYQIFEADEIFDPLGHIGGKEQTDLSEPEEMGINVTKDCVLNFSNGNMKLQWPYFSLPAGYTCPFATQCKTLPAKWKGTAKQGKFEKPASWEKNYQLAKGAKYLCYAGRAQAQYPGANIQAFSNLNLLKKFKTKEKMADLIVKSLRYHGLESTDLFRIHEAGDFFSQEYFDAWLEVARRMPGTLFYAYTVSLPFWLSRKGQIPKNFKLIASMDEDNEELINAEGLRYAKVVGSTEEARELGLRMDVDDMLAWGTDDSFALPLHGSQPKGSEAAEIRKKQTKKDETGKSFDEKLKDAKKRNQDYKNRLRAQVKSQLRGELPFDAPPTEGDDDFDLEIEESYYGLNYNKNFINENLEFGSENVLLQGHKGYDGKVFVHRNLNKPPYWTIKARNGEDAGLVIGYDKSVHLKNVVFVVGEKSRQRVLASGQKNVHAGVVGDIVDGGMNTNGWIPVTYNPYTNRTFVRVDNGEPIFKAKEAILKNEKEVYVKL
jgi:hypothetical protein